MAAITFSRPCWTLALVVLVAGAASTFTDQRIFTRRTGMNISLDFPVPSGTTSVWLKRPGSTKYVFYCRDGHPMHPSNQEESFNGRVKGMDCDKINDTFSVTVSNLTPDDSGLYEFHSDGRHFNETIILNVTDPGQTGGTTHDEEQEDGGKEDGWTQDGGKAAGGKADGPVGLIVGVTVLVSVLFVFAGMKFFMHRSSSRLPPV